MNAKVKESEQKIEQNDDCNNTFKNLKYRHLVL